MLTLLLVGVTLHRYEYRQVNMGVEFALTLYAADRDRANAAAKAGFDRAVELDNALSDYQQNSELNQALRRAKSGEWVRVSADLYNAIRASRTVAILTDGAFDPTVRPLVALWRTARRTAKLPDAAAIADAKSHVGIWNIDIDPRARAFRLNDPQTQLDFGGIGKGIACDEVIRAVRNTGVTSAIVEAGGDIAASDPPPGAIGWRVDLHGRTALVANEGISTSGDETQFVVINGVKYSHIVNPATGMGLNSGAEATIIGPLATFTDGLATAACVNPASIARFTRYRLIPR